MSSGKIDGTSVIGDIESHPVGVETGVNQNNDENNSEVTNTKKCDAKQMCFKVSSFATSTIPMFEWKGIPFKVEGFLLLMIIVSVLTDSLWSIGNAAGEPFLGWLFYSLSKNMMLISMVLIGCFLRIKLFGKSGPNTVAKADLQSEGGFQSQACSTQDEQKVEFKTVTVSYLGGIMTVNEMMENTLQQILYCVFPALYHGVLIVLFYCLGLAFRAPGASIFPIPNQLTFTDLCFWLRNASFYCMIMCLLPVPGFDGAALLTIFLRHRQWNSMMTTVMLVCTTACVITIFMVIGFVWWDIIAIYIAVLCSIKFSQFLFSKNDGNMNALKAMAKTAKKVNDIQSAT